MFFMRCAACAAITVMVELVTPAFAQDFPVKPIRFVVGPGSDLVARLIAQKITGMWGQQVVVDQRMGASGNIALETAAKSAPDGYTWLLSTATYTMNAAIYPQWQYKLAKDLDPVAMLATATFYVVVHPSVPAKSIQELIQLARAKPGQLNYSSAGVATPPHLAGEMFKYMAKVNIVHVPYKSAAAATTDLVGGQVQVSFQYAPIARPFVQSGKLRALAVTGAKRSLLAPDLPTVAESGVSGYEIIGWNGLHVPKGTPKRLVAKVGAAMLRIMNAPDVRERLLATANEPAPANAEEFAAFVKKEVAHWATVVAQTGIHGE